MLSRRDFIGGTLAVGVRAHTATRHSRIIVDSQVHVWPSTIQDRRAQGSTELLVFTYERLLPLMNEAGVTGAILIPPAGKGDDDDYAIQAAKEYPNRFAVMGRIPLNSPIARGQLAKWKEQRGMLGVRISFKGAETNWLSDGTADWFWPAAANARIPVMAPIHGQAPKYRKIVEQNPDLIFIIDHMGVTVEMARAGELPRGIDETTTFSKYPNVSVKMSAIAHKSTEPYPFRDMSPYIRRVFDAFGPTRCFWGTDYTAGLAIKFPYSYRQHVTHFTETLEFLSEEDKDWIMGRAILNRLNWAL